MLSNKKVRFKKKERKHAFDQEKERKQYLDQEKRKGNKISTKKNKFEDHLFFLL